MKAICPLTIEGEQIYNTGVILPDRLLTTDTVSLSITDSTSLTQCDTAGSAGPVTQGAPEPRLCHPHAGHHHCHHQHHGVHCYLVTGVLSVSLNSYN